MELVNPTLHSLEEWNELILRVKEDWRQLIQKEWNDLPPDVTKSLITASRAIADVGDAVDAQLNCTVNLEGYANEDEDES